MAIFDNEEDSKTVKVIGYWGLGFGVLTVLLILLSIYVAA